jgi:cobalt-precorrin 5A hydrolase
MIKVLGVGCRRGVPLEDLESAVAEFLPEGLSSVSLIASCDVKADEKGLLELARKHGKELRFFAASELSGVEVPNPSERVRAQVGTGSVCEAAALLASGGRLLKEKRKFNGATLALAGKD